MNRPDLRQIVESVWGAGKSGGSKGRLYRSRWRDDKDPSFVVYADGYKDFATDEHGDHIDFIRREFALDNRAAAAAWLAERGYAVPTTHQRQQYVPNECPEHSAPPSGGWQETLWAAVKEAQAYLWSGRTDANKALAYLRYGRGLTEASIRRAGLGFNPGNRTLPIKIDDKPVKLYAGISIPIAVEGVLFAVKINTFGAVGLARALDRAPIENFAKYVHVTGSKTGAPYMPAGALIDGLPVLFVEGEYDAIIGAQTLEGLANVVTVGSATNGLGRRWRELLRGRSVYVLPDNDDAGRTGAGKLAAQLQAQIVTLPDAKDANEYYLSDGDLRRWFNSVTMPCASTSVGHRANIGTPHTVATDEGDNAGIDPDARSAAGNVAAGAAASWVSALVGLRGGGVNAAMVYLLIKEGANRGLLDPQAFTVDDLYAVAQAMNWSLKNDQIIRRGLILAVEMGFIDRFTHKERESLIGKNVNKSRGRQTTVYALRSHDDMRAAILATAMPEIEENAYPSPDDQGSYQALAEVPALALAHAGVNSEDAKAIAWDIKQKRRGIRSRQDGRGWHKAQQMRAELEAALRDMTPLALDPAIAIVNADTFKKAIFRQAVVIIDGDRPGMKKLMAIAGVRSAKTLKKLMTAVNVGVVETDVDQLTEVREIRPGQDAHATIRQHASEIGGAVPIALKIGRDNWESSPPGAVAHTAQESLDKGLKVAVAYRHPYTVKVLPLDAPKPSFPTMTVPTKRKESDPVSMPECRSRNAERVEIGRYRPSWVAGQIAYLMTRLGWVHELKSIDPETGETLAKTGEKAFVNPTTGAGCSINSRNLSDLLNVFAGREIPFTEVGL